MSCPRSACQEMWELGLQPGVSGVTTTSGSRCSGFGGASFGWSIPSTLEAEKFWEDCLWQETATSCRGSQPLLWPEDPRSFWKEFHQDRENKQRRGTARAGPTRAGNGPGGHSHEVVPANAPLMFAEMRVPLHTAWWLQSHLCLRTVPARQNACSILWIRKLRLRRALWLAWWHTGSLHYHPQPEHSRIHGGVQSLWFHRLGCCMLGVLRQALLCSGPQFAMWDLITSISQNEDLAPYMVCEMILGGHRVK